MLVFLRYSLYVSGINTLTAAEDRTGHTPVCRCLPSVGAPRRTQDQIFSTSVMYHLCGPDGYAQASATLVDSFMVSHPPLALLLPSNQHTEFHLPKKNGTSVKARPDPISLPPLQGGLFFPVWKFVPINSCNNPKELGKSQKT